MSARVRKVLVATDRSETAERAVAWAADLAERYEAELLVLQVMVPDRPKEPTARTESTAGNGNVRTRVVVHADPAKAIVDTAREEGVDVIVMGNVGLRSRSRFLVRNVPDVVIHAAPCSVFIVDTASGG